VTVRYPSLEDHLHAAACDGVGFGWLPGRDDPDGEETYQLMLAIAAAPGADLKVVEAEVAAWNAERLHQRK
jgi:hypothetical protein